LAAINHGFYLTPWNEPNKPLLDDDVITLPELIQARGPYTTAAFDNLINFRSHMKQFVRGFEYYVNTTCSPAWKHHHVLAEEVNYRLLPWLEEHADEASFVFVHYWDPHTPYNMPERFRGTFDQRSSPPEFRQAPDGYAYAPGWGVEGERLAAEEGTTIDLYDDEVFYVDHAIGVVVQELERLGLLDDTAIIVTSDHGEDLGVHGLWGHATAHETTIRVPLIVRDVKHLDPGKRVRGFVQHADNLPTILEYFPHQDRPGFQRVATGLCMPELPTKFDGADLRSLARGERVSPKEIVVETGEHRAYLAPPWKLIWHTNGSSELFNLETDPLELHDRAVERPALVEEVRGKLRSWVDRNLAEERTDPIFGRNGAWTCYIGDLGKH